MNFRRLAILPLMALLFSGCTASRSTANPDDCEKAIKNYSKMIRWQEQEKAAMVFIGDQQRKDFRVAAESLRQRAINITDFRILSQQCLIDKKTAEATVEFDYYQLTDSKLKTVTDKQTWVYHDQDSPETVIGWKLTSPLPAFK